jgi:hypothetical protein
VPRRLLLLIGLALALPAPAAAANATIVSRDVPLGAQRSLAAGQPSTRFNLVGLHWRGPGTVQFRTHSLSGRWSGWVDAAPEAEDQPDAGTAERARLASWRLGNPWWVGASDRIEYRLRGKVTRLRAYFVWSPPAGVPSRTLQKAGSPAIVPRSGWNADEKIRRNTPAFASAIRLAVVHHTAGANGYTAAQSPSIVRAIELYHVKGNGWNDIGYNFLVDRFGTVFEGRFGGIERNVIGAHAEGFNTGSVGVAVMGEYSSLPVSAKARDSLARLLAWRLDLAHVDPASTLSFISGGNGRFPAGLPVFLRTVSGHRDTGFTDCPGTALYNLLTTIAGEVATIGLPKLYAPVATGSVPGIVRFRARLSSALPWTVGVTDAVGTTVASTSGLGTNVDWTWDATLAPPGTYSYSIRSEDSVTPAVGTIGGAAPAVGFSVTELAADPGTVTPNADLVADQTTISYKLTEPGNVTMTLKDESGALLATIANKAWRRAGAHAFRFDPVDLPDGVYLVEILATATGARQATASTQIVVSRTLGKVTAERLAFSPNADGRADRIGFRFELTASAQIRVRILKQGKWVATPFKGPLEPGAQKIEWDGAKRVGRLVDGQYEAVVEAIDSFATTSVAVPFSADTRAPKVKILQRSPLKLWLSEPATVTLRFGTRRLVYDAVAAGEALVPKAPKLGLVRAVAWDAAGNKSQPASRH